ncbi:MAG: 50S ribosomal protein L23 [Acidimicrobiaceae bacterium]|nr:50S ribosomal protein L23 [Acidimicrobiaceae bacterium]
MSGFDPYSIVQKPIVSEKSYKLMDEGVYTFIVADSATKVDIRKAVEQLFEVNVLDVNTLVRKGKRKRNSRKGTWSTKPDRKHAMVRLADGQKIDMFEK